MSRGMEVPPWFGKLVLGVLIGTLGFVASAAVSRLSTIESRVVELEKCSARVDAQYAEVRQGILRIEALLMRHIVKNDGVAP